jgi:hypothetical protein
MSEDNFVDQTIDWTMGLAESFLNNWDKSAEWSPENPMPAFLITLTPDDEDDINTLSPDLPYFLDFEDGQMTYLKYSKRDWSDIIRNIVDYRKPIGYMVVCETGYTRKDLDTKEVTHSNGVVVLFVTVDNFAKVFLGNIEKTDKGLVIKRTEDEILEDAMMSPFFKSLIHYDLGVSPILQ